MKKITLFLSIIFIGVIVLTQCSKKTEPTPNTPTTPTLTPGSPNTITINNITSTTTQSLTVNVPKFANEYYIYGSCSSGYYLSFTFFSKPTYSYNVSLTNVQEVQVEITDNKGDTWTPLGGTANITVKKDSLTISLTDAIFAGSSGNSGSVPTSLTVTCSMSSNQPLPGQSGIYTVTINGTTETVSAQNVNGGLQYSNGVETEQPVYSFTAVPTSGNYTFYVSFISGKDYEFPGSEELSTTNYSPSITIQDQYGNQWIPAYQGGYANYTDTSGATWLTITNGVFVPYRSSLTDTLKVNGTIYSAY